MILSIPLQATPNQRLSPLPRLCHNRVPLAAAGGIFYFDDAHGSLNPHWQGLGSRFRLLWSAP